MKNMRAKRKNKKTAFINSRRARHEKPDFSKWTKKELEKVANILFDDLKDKKERIARLEGTDGD